MNDKFTTDTRLNATMARGHQMRHGHKLEGYYVATADDGIVKLVRTCCASEDKA